MYVRSIAHDVAAYLCLLSFEEQNSRNENNFAKRIAQLNLFFQYSNVFYLIY